MDIKKKTILNFVQFTIFLTSINLFGLHIVQIPTHQERFPRAYYCGGIALVQAGMQEKKEATVRGQIEQCIARHADMTNTNTLELIAQRSGLNAHCLSLSRSHLPITLGVISYNPRISPDQARTENFHAVIAKFKRSTNRFLHFVCIFEPHEGPHGFLITIDRQNRVLRVHTDQFTHMGMPAVDAYVNQINESFERGAIQHPAPDHKERAKNREHLEKEQLEEAIRRSRSQAAHEEAMRKAQHAADARQHWEEEARLQEAIRLSREIRHERADGAGPADQVPQEDDDQLREAIRQSKIQRGTAPAVESEDTQIQKAILESARLLQEEQGLTQAMRQSQIDADEVYARRLQEEFGQGEEF